MAMNEPLPMQVVCEMARNIPCSPWLLPQLLDVLDNENSSVSDIEHVIVKDPGLASAILRLANSAVFTTGRKCDSCSEAMMRLGRREIYRLAASSVAGRWLVQDVKGYGWEPGDLCKHSLCVAVAAELLAIEKSGEVEPMTAYTAGLLHDMGKLALAYACSDSFDEIYQYQQKNKCSWQRAENALLGYDHCMIGGTLLESWSYPVNLVEVACYYPRPHNAGMAHQDLVTMVHAAKHMAIALGMGVGEEGFTTEMDNEMLEKKGYTSDLMEQIMPDVVEKSTKLLAAAADKANFGIDGGL